MIAGIDVGLKGAIGLLYENGTAYVYDMPVFSKEVNAAAPCSESFHRITFTWKL